MRLFEKHNIRIPDLKYFKCMQESKNILNIIAIHEFNKNEIVFGWISLEVEKVNFSLKNEIRDLQNQFESVVVQVNNDKYFGNCFNKILNNLRLEYSNNIELADFFIKNSNLTQPEFFKKYILHIVHKFDRC